MALKKIGICGHFGKNKDLLNGQTIKTKIITNELEKIYDIEEIQLLDTHNFVKQAGSKVLELVQLMKSSKNIMMFPAHKGLRVLAPLIVSFNKIFHRKLHYVVIGGWLPAFLDDKKYLMKCLKKFDYIYVETTSMRVQLEKLGFNNIVIMPNCKELNILTNEELIYSKDKPYKLCTLSRVMEEKGITEAINAVKEINSKMNENLFSLDIYGPIDDSYKEKFKHLINETPEYIKYRGVVDFDKTTDVLKNYFALLFPTKFYTEGIPGTIIDAYSAGVPVIASEWENFKDIIDNKVTGYGYQFADYNELVNLLDEITKNPENIFKIKGDCLLKAEEFSSSKIINNFSKKGYWE